MGSGPSDAWVQRRREKEAQRAEARKLLLKTISHADCDKTKVALLDLVSATFWMDDCGSPESGGWQSRTLEDLNQDALDALGITKADLEGM